jgi:predicted ATPase
MLKRFHIESFKVIGTLDITLDRLTVLVGPNACGKSSVLQAMSLLCRMRDKAPEEIFGELKAIQEQTTLDATAPLLLRAQGESFTIEWCAKALGKKSSWSEDEAPQLSYESAGERRIYKDVWGKTSKLIEDALVLPKSELFQFEFENLAAPAVIRPAPRLAANGSGLAAVLGHLALEQPLVFQRIHDAILAVIPSIRRVRVRHTVTYGQPLDSSGRMVQGANANMPAYEILFDTRSGRDIPAKAMSDGTLRVLALLTAALSHEPPNLILLDDLERGIHPRAMVELVRLLQKTLDEVPDLQIVATTHSPDLLDQLDPSQIRLLWLGEDGLTRCVSMNEHLDFDAWRDIMTPGEMWAVFDRKDAGAS